MYNKIINYFQNEYLYIAEIKNMQIYNIRILCIAISFKLIFLFQYLIRYENITFILFL